MRQEWFTPAEISVHNTSRDCWVTLNGKVLDLTRWVQAQTRLCPCPKTCSCANKRLACEPDCVERCPCFNKGFVYCDSKRLATTILAYAGKDISHWFIGDEWVTYTHPIVGSKTPFYRHGAEFQRPVVPSTRWRPYHQPWWLDPGLIIGKVTAKTRPIKITNMMTGSTVTLEVCSEETIYQIMNRYFPHNSHMNSYTWRYQGRGLCLTKTLDQNGVLDEREKFAAVSLAENLHVPAILLYFNDDLTEDPPSDMLCFCEDRECNK